MYKGFSPRNGEVILKDTIGDATTTHTVFQSPQWGDCSKDEIHAITDKNLYEFQSSQWGDSYKGRENE